MMTVCAICLIYLAVTGIMDRKQTPSSAVSTTGQPGAITDPFVNPPPPPPVPVTEPAVEEPEPPVASTEGGTYPDENRIAAPVEEQSSSEAVSENSSKYSKEEGWAYNAKAEKDLAALDKLLSN